MMIECASSFSQERTTCQAVATRFGATRYPLPVLPSGLRMKTLACFIRLKASVSMSGSFLQPRQQGRRGDNLVVIAETQVGAEYRVILEFDLGVSCARSAPPVELALLQIIDEGLKRMPRRSLIGSPHLVWNTHQISPCSA